MNVKQRPSATGWHCRTEYTGLAARFAAHMRMHACKCAVHMSASRACHPRHMVGGATLHKACHATVIDSTVHCLSCWALAASLCRPDGGFSLATSALTLLLEQTTTVYSAYLKSFGHYYLAVPVACPCVQKPLLPNTQNAVPPEGSAPSSQVSHLPVLI